MTAQLSFLAPTQHGEQIVSIEAHRLSRLGDPATSKAAARRIAPKLKACQAKALSIMSTYGSGTLMEIAYRKCVAALTTDDAALMANTTQLYHELARRAPELERACLVRVQQDPSLPCRCRGKERECHCQDVTRGGARVWEVS